MKKIYLIAAVVAIFAGFATYFFANELKTSKIVTGVDEAAVLIAIEDIDKNTVLTKEMFQTVKLPVNSVSYGTLCDINDVIGCMATENIYMGEQLMARKIEPVGTEQAIGRLSYELSNGMYAYTISVEIENGVAYFIKEYDCINIYDKTSPSTEPALKNITVIKLSDYTANIQQDGGTEIKSYAVLTLALTKDQIPKMMSVNNPRVVLVSHIESHSLADEIAAADIPEDRTGEPKTNYGMGEITTAPPEEQK